MVVLLLLNDKYCDISMGRGVTKLDLSILIQFEHYSFQKLNDVMCHQFILK